MRKTFWSIFAVVLLLASSFVLAENENNQNGVVVSVTSESGVNVDSDVIVVAGDENSNEGVITSKDASELKKYREERRKIIKKYQEERKMLVNETAQQLREMLKLEKEELKDQLEQMKGEYKNLSEEEQNRTQASKRMDFAVHALLEMRRLGNLSGGIGPQISEIAGKLNLSAEKIFKLEEKINKRSGWAKFWTGNRKAAKEINKEVEKNEEMLTELKNAEASCSCDEETKALMQEQIKEMEKEQERLKQIAKQESKKTGLFGWLF